jgi:hypothetical protein
VTRQPGRPSVKELLGKIEQAREHVAKDDWLPVDPLKVLPEFEDLECFTAGERQKALEAALNEINPEDYEGQRPPAKAYEQPCKNAELFAFCWHSTHFKKKMYLKFCFVQKTFYVVSIHRSRFS